MSTLEIPEMKDQTLKNIFCSDTFSCCTMTNRSLSTISDLLIEEQIFLDESLHVYHNLIIPFQMKGGATHEPNVYETLCRCYNELLSVTVLNVRSLWDYYNRTIEAYEVVVVTNVDEYLSIYKSYLNAICDIIALGGFAQIAKLIDVLQVLSNVFKDKVKGKDGNITNETIIAFVLQHPLQRLSR